MTIHLITYPKYSTYVVVDIINYLQLQLLITRDAEAYLKRSNIFIDIINN